MDLSSFRPGEPVTGKFKGRQFVGFVETYLGHPAIAITKWLDAEGAPPVSDQIRDLPPDEDTIDVEKIEQKLQEAERRFRDLPAVEPRKIPPPSDEAKAKLEKCIADFRPPASVEDQVLALRDHHNAIRQIQRLRERFAIQGSAEDVVDHVLGFCDAIGEFLYGLCTAMEDRES